MFSKNIVLSEFCFELLIFLKLLNVLSYFPICLCRIYIKFEIMDLKCKFLLLIGKLKTKMNKAI